MLSKSLIKNEYLLAFALYLAAIALFYFPVVFCNKSLQPSLYSPYGVTQSWPYGYEGRTPENTFHIDLATPAFYEWPVNKLIGDIYKRGELPLWNPYQAAGTPLAAQYSTRAFFPYQIIENISPVWTWDYFILGRLLIAGFFTFLFLRAFGLSFSPSFLGGLFYMFSGAFTWFINLEQFTNVAMMVPVYMLTIERLLKRQRLRDMAFAGVSTGIVLLAGQPEIALYVLFLGASYYFFRILPAFKATSLLRFGVSFVLGLCLAAPLILPFLELESAGFHLHPPKPDIGFEKLSLLLGLLAPALTEYPQKSMWTELGFTPGGEAYFTRIFPDNGYWDHLGGYTGVMVLFLMLSGAALSWKNRHRLWPACLIPLLFGVLIVLKNFGFRPFLWLGYLPIFNQACSMRWAGPAWVFAFGFSAAIGFEVLKSTFYSEKTRPAKSDYIIVAVSAAVILVCYLILAFAPLMDFIRLISHDKGFNPDSMSNLKTQFKNIFDISVPVLVLFAAPALFVLNRFSKEKICPAILVLLAIELWWAIPRGYQPGWAYWKLAPFAIALFSFFFLALGKTRAALSCAVLFIVAFVSIDLASRKGFPERYDPFTAAPYAAFLQKEAGFNRVTGGHGMLYPNFSSAIGLQDVRYINALSVGTFHRFRSKYLESEAHPLWFTGIKRISWGKAAQEMETEKDFMANIRAFSLLGVKYIVLPPGSVLSPDLTGGVEFPVAYSGKDAVVYENPFTLPRVYIAREIRQAPSYSAAQDISILDNDNLAGEIVLEKPAPAGYEPDLDADAASDRVEITVYRTNGVTVRAEAREDGVLVLTDVYFPGWKAYVDGNESEIYRVNGLVRGVFLKKGAHEIEFVYRPLSFMAGAALFVIGAVTALVFLIVRRN